MLTGYVSEEYARMEHRTWFETLPPRALAVGPEALQTPAATKAPETDSNPPTAG